jgi:hypothetical protein
VNLWFLLSQSSLVLPWYILQFESKLIYYSIPCSQEPATGLNPEPDEPSSPLNTLHYTATDDKIFLSSIYPSGIPAKMLYAFFISPKYATCPTHLLDMSRNRCLKTLESH